MTVAIDTVDTTLEFCKSIDASCTASLSLLSRLAHGNTEHSVLTLADLNQLLAKALQDKNKELLNLICLALKLKESFSAGHCDVEYIGLGRNPANLYYTDCLLLRMGSRIYSYKPLTLMTTMERWDTRMKLILRVPTGLTAFSQLLASRTLVKVGPVWDAAADKQLPSALRNVPCTYYAEGQLNIQAVKLRVTRESGIGSSLVSDIQLLLDDECLIHLSDDALFDAIATGVLQLGTDEVLRSSLLRYIVHVKKP